MTREKTKDGSGTVTFWECTSATKYHLPQRWLAVGEQKRKSVVDDVWAKKQKAGVL